MSDHLFKGDGKNLEVRLLKTESGFILSKDGKWEALLNVSDLAKGEGEKLCEKLASSKVWSFMSQEHDANFTLNSPFFKNTLEDEVIFFGGSFNPWHEGHRACLDLCPSENIVIIPDSNPFKVGQENFDCPFEKYLQICQNLKDTPYSVYPGFCYLKNGNPTIDWLPNVSIPKKSLLIGDDSFLSFDKWKDYEELLSNIDSLYVVPRVSSQDDLLKMKEKLMSISSCLKIHFLGHHNYEEVSSTKIREAKKKGS